MLAGAAPQVRQVKIAGIVAIMLAAALASCRQPRRIAPGPDATAAPLPTVGATPSPPPPRGKQIVIAYSSNLLGEYEPCG
jgi:hypothetical protein